MFEGSSTEINHSAGNIRAPIPDVEELVGIFGTQYECFSAEVMAT